MKCQKCHTENIQEAMKCSNCSLRFDKQKKIKPAQVKQNPFVLWLKEFIKHIIFPRGLKLWIIIGCFILFVLPALFGTIIAYFSKNYLIAQHSENSKTAQKLSQSEQEQLHTELHLIKINQDRLKGIQKEINDYFLMNDHYPKTLEILNNKSVLADKTISMNALGYLIVQIEPSKPIIMIAVPFKQANKQLAWDCYILGFDSNLADTECVEISSINDIPVSTTPTI